MLKNKFTEVINQRFNVNVETIIKQSTNFKIIDENHNKFCNLSCSSHNDDKL